MRIQTTRRRRGFTMVEVMTGVALSTVIMLAVVGLQFYSGLSINNLTAETRARAARMKALDDMRIHISNATIGSLAVAGGGTTLSYRDPNLSLMIPCVYAFSSATGRLTHTAPGEAPRIVAGDLAQVAFALSGVPGLQNGVSLRVKSIAPLAKGKIDSQDAETFITLRNYF